jgi:hypothetical protein
MKHDTDLVHAHLVSIEWPVKYDVTNPCSEIMLPEQVLMEPAQITLLRLKGICVFDITESLGMEPELVQKQSCYLS